jgi:capsule polysaccharide export protein KpsC/LpsZ
MLRAAQEENPDRQILVRAHPDAVAGRCQGYLLPWPVRRG